MLWYAINLFIIFIFILLYIWVKKSNQQWSNFDNYLVKMTNNINSSKHDSLLSISQKISKMKTNENEPLINKLNQLVDSLNAREQIIIKQQQSLIFQINFLESILNSLSDGIVIIDSNYTITRSTPKIATWFNKKGKDILNTSIFNYLQIKDETEIEKLNENEIFIKGCQNETFIASSLKLTSEDKQKNFLIIIKNITTLKEIEELKEDFVATLTHDLKTPIIAEANIIDFLLTEKLGPITDTQTEALENMKSSNQELIELVQTLLETYKVRHGHIELYKEPINILELLKETISDLNTPLNKSGTELSIQAEDSPILKVDKFQIKRVFKNLIQNAIYHNDNCKKIDITIKTDKKWTYITITDFGKGISKEDLELIFNKYYSTAKKFRKIGTGLGLFLAKNIVTSHDGELSVTSTPNVNTSFCIKLPNKD